MNDYTIKAELKDLVYSLMIPLYDEMFINKDLSEKELLNKWHSLKEYYFKSIVTEATFTSIEKIVLDLNNIKKEHHSAVYVIIQLYPQNAKALFYDFYNEKIKKIIFKDL